MGVDNHYFNVMDRSNPVKATGLSRELAGYMSEKLHEMGMQNSADTLQRGIRSKAAPAFTTRETDPAASFANELAMATQKDMNLRGR